MLCTNAKPAAVEGVDSNAARRTWRTQLEVFLVGSALGYTAAILPARTGMFADDRPARAPTSNFIKWGVSNQDLRKTQHLDKQERAGEFVLQNERPLRRKFIEFDLRQIVADTATQRRQEYSEVFARAGLSSEISQRLQRHLAKIHSASLEAEVAIQQVQDARFKYDQQIRRLMAEPAYLRYRDYELAKPAKREYDRVRAKAANEGVQLDPAFQDTVVSLLQQLQAYTVHPSHGPFDNLPVGAVGEPDSIELLSRNRVDLALKAEQLQKQCQARLLPIATTLALQRYFTARLQQFDEMLDRLHRRSKQSAVAPASPRDP